MRNHASPAHGNDESVAREEVLALAVILQTSLFVRPLPDPGHSIAALFEPIKATELAGEPLQLAGDQIRSLRSPDLRNLVGFLLDIIATGVDPASKNGMALFPIAWSLAPEELRPVAGLRYHTLTINPASDESADKKARARILDALVAVDGVKYIPDGSRAILYRHAAKLLAEAKDSTYGWSAEATAARQLAQFGPYVPAIAFDEVYQEIISVWCGNYWGRSGAYKVLGPFIDALNTDQLRKVLGVLCYNERAKNELGQPKPKAAALSLVSHIRGKFTLTTHQAEADSTTAMINAL